jgi:DNA-binding MarR family transcriptional regulator
MTTADKVLQALEPYKLKREKPGQYRCNSPFRANSESMTFVVTINGGEHGGFFDFHAEANPKKGSLYELAHHLGIAVPAAVPVASTKRAYSGIEDYAKAHGITGDVLRHWQWRETTYQSRPALEIPTRTGQRWRFLDGEKGKAVYKSVEGYRRCWYGLNNFVMGCIEDGSPLVICNGEISTITGQHYLIAAIALTGGEKGEIPDDLLAELKGHMGSHKRIIIALDCDKAGRAAARGLADQLTGAGYDVTAVDLGLDAGGDLADFCMLYGHEAARHLEKLPALPVEVEGSRWTFASVDDVLRLPAIEWLIPREIPRRGLTMLYGPSGSFKSFVMLDKSLRLAANGHNVVYIAAEGEHGYRQRLEAWIAHHKVKPTKLTFVLGQVDLFDTEDLTQFSQIVNTYKPSMIVVDTFAMCAGEADENNSRDMSRIVQGCKAMSRVIDGVIVIVHHTNAEGRKERGSKILRNSCDTIIRVTKEDDVIVVQSQKTKDTEAFKPYYLSPVIKPLGYKNNIGEDVTSIVLLPADKVERKKGLTEIQKAVLEALAMQPNATFAELQEVAELETRGAAQRAIKSLVKHGYLRIEPGGSRHLTEEGQQYLESESLESAESAESPTSENVRIADSPDSRDSGDSRFSTGVRQPRLLDAFATSTSQYDFE